MIEDLGALPGAIGFPPAAPERTPRRSFFADLARAFEARVRERGTPNPGAFPGAFAEWAADVGGRLPGVSSVGPPAPLAPGLTGGAAFGGAAFAGPVASLGALKGPNPRLSETPTAEAIPAANPPVALPPSPAAPGMVRATAVSPGDASGGATPAPSDPASAPPALDPFGAVLGPSVPEVSPPSVDGAWSLSEYPRPSGDTGRGFDWAPTLHSSPDVVDRFVSKAKAMGASWIVILNDGAQSGANDYLIQQLVANHIEPIVRLYTPMGQPISGDLEGMVRHDVSLGAHYFQPYNEPNLSGENPDGQVSPTSYVDRWIPAARAILAGGGLPGIGALAPGAPTDDVAFLRSTFEQLKQRGRSDLLSHAWISLHNYTFNRPIDYADDSNGFLKFRWYDQVARDELGRSLPVIGTEGGPRLGDDQDPRYPAVDAARRDRLVRDSFQYLSNREPYFFAQTQWLLANEAAGGHDSAWRADALFKADGSPTTLAQDLSAPGDNA